MKTTSVIAAAICLANTVAASPLQERGIFGSGDNLVSNIFDSPACTVSSIIGGENPRCHGKGNGVVEPLPGSNGKSIAYTYVYDTTQDGAQAVTIVSEQGKKCTYALQADGKDITKVIDDTAKKCLQQKK